MSFPKPSSRRRESAAGMPFIMLAVLIDMMSIGLIVPVLPSLVGDFTGSQADQAFWFGVVLLAFGIANFFGSPVLGALSDVHGRRPVLLLGFCGLALNFIVTGLAGSLWVLAAVRLVGGAMQANSAVANAYVADITEPAERAKRFGMLGAMFGVGFIIGPVMGDCWGRSTCGCRSSSPGEWPSSTCFTAISSCPNPCRPSAARGFPGGRFRPSPRCAIWPDCKGSVGWSRWSG
jgi:MFS family permease